MDNDKIYVIKKRISSLEWDLANVHNEQIKALRTKQLEELRAELKTLKQIK